MFLSDENICGKPSTKEFGCMINVPQRNKLSHPNKIDKIKISYYIIEFDDNAKLAIGTSILIGIYTFEHRNPVSIEFYIFRRILIPLLLLIK
ncbi:BMN2 family, Pseudo gene [Babesia microti strain RI]|uniref:BMN2 family, Pseudo protein n=1 Tax=Babesia microti (strain RI) TaxID=1133968 RepID=A0A1N6LW05_BABMR|nr:BMN2 family, Pseudo gene [Babesia microti strain RI]SIO73117.1 BMN2 family, Pseudo gene [Babesia microti strain RI]|eukprot:XP_021337229.1 BMN2 family, Pseudo gene [Babesia microti strain RI]